jgi:hypothetical protein
MSIGARRAEDGFSQGLIDRTLTEPSVAGSVGPPSNRSAPKRRPVVLLAERLRVVSRTKTPPLGRMALNKVTHSSESSAPPPVAGFTSAAADVDRHTMQGSS